MSAIDIFKYADMINLFTISINKHSLFIHKSIAIIAFILLNFSIFSQEKGAIFTFDGNEITEDFDLNLSTHILSKDDSIIKIEVNKTAWNGLSFRFDTVDISDESYISSRIKCDFDLSFRIYIYDSEGNRMPVDHFISAADTFRTYVFNFKEVYNEYSWDNYQLGHLNNNDIVSILFNFNPGGNYVGNIWLDDIRIGNQADTSQLHKIISSVKIDTVSIEIETNSLSVLENDPTGDNDVYGNFYNNEGVKYENIELHYRGASTILNLVGSDRPQRNWKVKVSKSQKYRNRREWNFQYTNNMKHELSYHVMRTAGVKCVSSRAVALELNNEYHGLYLEYEDPDNKDWLRESFGNNDGDLYKVAYDMPGQRSYFG